MNDQPLTPIEKAQSDFVSNLTPADKANIEAFFSAKPAPASELQPCETVQKDWNELSGLTDEAKAAHMYNLALSLEGDLNAVIREINEFTAHVGAPTFKEAVDVLLRTKAQDEAKIEEMHDRIKLLGGELKRRRVMSLYKDDIGELVERMRDNFPVTNEQEALIERLAAEIMQENDNGRDTES